MLIAFVIGIGSGFYASNFYTQNANVDNDTSEKELRLGEKFSYINPLLDCDLGPNYISKNSIKPFKPTIQNLIDKAVSENRASLVSVYFRDLNNGTWFGINDSEIFFPASLMKLPILIYYLKQSEVNPKLLESEIEYSKGQENIPQFYDTKSSVMIGKTYKIKDLLEQAIKKSDNNAAFLLFQAVGKDKFVKFFKDFGLDVPMESTNDYINVRTYGTFFRVLFNSSYLPNQYSESALKLLSETEFNHGLTAKLPGSLVVSHKFGENQNNLGDTKQLHDCGIVYYPNKPYLICVMTRGKDFISLGGVIADISKATYDEVNRQHN
jgi:beta-lactamase class A